jgi:hypothetical protein
MEIPYYNLKYSYWKDVAFPAITSPLKHSVSHWYGHIRSLVMAGAGPPYLPPPPFAIWYIISSVVNLLTRSFTHCFVTKRIIWRYYILEQGLQRKFLDMLSEHSAAQGINHLWKFTSGFIGPQILNFARSLSLSPGPQSSLVPPCKISFGGPVPIYNNVRLSV